MRLFPAHSTLGCGILLGSLSGCAFGNGAAFTPESDPQLGTILTPGERDVSADDPMSTLATHVSGVIVSGTPDGGIAVRIRGPTSIMASTAPLYVIDGLPIEAGPGGALMGINPHDIASIQVLKDAASTAFYGVRGANGVILIKTKHAH